jgi:hypothetical protein
LRAAPTLTTAMYAGVALKWLWFALALYLALARLKLERGAAIDRNGGRAIRILGRPDPAQMTLW